MTTTTTAENDDAWQLALRERPQTAARVAADWLHEIADRLSSGRPLDALHEVWPLLLVEAKVAELVRSVSTAALWEAETHIFGAPLKRL
ncbi:hypothetical protein [Mesorhizobium caraganae]|uniref:hypothetical protein n=1 Tax=Mesorhizobium caraganae TaxID=483206 RepID=UPI0033369062